MKQHTKPCSDCPWRRAALPGWLGSLTAEEWLSAVHGEAQIDCHVQFDRQCAGAAIYRANVSKVPRDRTLLVLSPDRSVFGSRTEFLKYHSKDEKAV